MRATLFCLLALFALWMPSKSTAQDPFEVAWGRVGYDVLSTSKVQTSPNGLMILAHYQNTIRIFRISDGQMLHQFNSSDAKSHSTWASDSTKLFYVEEQNDKLFQYTLSTRTHTLIRNFPNFGPTTSISDISTSPDGTVLSVLTAPSSIYFHDLAAGTTIGPFAFTSTSDRIKWLPNSQAVSVNNYTGGPVIITKTGQVRTSTLPAAESTTCSPDSTTVLSRSNFSVSATRVSDGATLWTKELSFKPVSLEYFGDGTHVVTHSRDNTTATVRVLSANSTLLQRTSRTFDANFVHFNQPVLLGTLGSKVLAFSVPTGSGFLHTFSTLEVEAVQLPIALLASNSTEPISPEDYYQTVSTQRRLYPTLLNPTSASPIQSVSAPDTNMSVLQGFNGTTGAVSQLFQVPSSLGLLLVKELKPSPDGRLVFVSGQLSDGTIRVGVYSLVTQNLIGTADLGNIGVSATGFVEFSNTGTFTYKVGIDLRVYATNLTTGAISLLRTFPQVLTFSSLSVDGNSLAMVRPDKSIVVSSTATGLTQAIVAASNFPLAVQGMKLVSALRLVTFEQDPGSGRLIARIWNTFPSSATLIRRVEDQIPTLPNWVIDVSPDLRYLTFANWESNGINAVGTVRLVDAASGVLLRSWNKPLFDLVLSDIAFSPSGDALFLASTNSVAHIRLPVSVLGLAISPATVFGGTGATGSVFVTAQAGASGAQVTLSANSDRVTIPSALIIQPFQRSGSFAVQTKGVNTPTLVTVTASRGTSSATSRITINPASLATLTLDPDPVAPGSTATGRITLNALAGPGGIQFALTSSNPGAGTLGAATVTVPEGASTATLTFNTAASPSVFSTVIGATSLTPSLSATVTLRITPRPTLTFTPAAVKGGFGTILRITIPDPAPTGGRTFSLSSNSAALVVPAGITIPAGQTTKEIAVMTKPVATVTTATVTATSPGFLAATKGLRVDPPTVKSIDADTDLAISGETITFTIVLDGRAPAGGLAVPISSNNTNLLQVPSATVFVPAGQTSVTFQAVAKPTLTAGVVTITAGGRTVTIAIWP